MKAKQLKLHGKPFDPSMFIDRTTGVRAFLDKAPEDTLYESPDIINAAEIPESTLANSRPTLIREGYALKIGRVHVYGCKAAIAELKRRLTN